MEKPVFYTFKQVLEILQTSPNTLRARIRNGDIKAKKFGNEWRFSKKAIEEFGRGCDMPKSDTTVTTLQNYKPIMIKNRPYKSYRDHAKEIGII